MHPPSPDQVLQALAETGRPACPVRAAGIAGAIAAYGSLDWAAAALANDEAQDRLADLLDYREALAERENPARRAARLRREAQDLDARAEPAWAEAAEFHGKARHRQLQGEAALADDFLHRARAAERLAAALEEEAFAMRLRSALLLGQAERAQDWSDILRRLAA